ncbi:phd transcription factor [Niveomyces insectorum RCEF 264]|uniref:Phd transcription factor n=1 Tax=Niveomyces insectorum RCEF 264 TaxID=1081102 RepID=A0A167Y878_9HYPO|nr:phd transcription factor [Niveomyces insectorum RCEF 264]
MAIIPPLAGAAASGGGSNNSNSARNNSGHKTTSDTADASIDRGRATTATAVASGSGKPGGGKSAGKSSSRAAGGSNAPSISSSARASPAAGTLGNQHGNNSSASSSKAKTAQANTNVCHGAGGGGGSSGGGSGSGSGSIPASQNGPTTPLSSMLSAPLDLNSVERRGQPTASRETKKRNNRPHDLEEAPIYCPTEEEWKEPMEYMRKITPEARKYGICKIIPPDSWNPPFAIDTQRFHFQTRKQELNSVEGSTRVNLSYLEGLFKYHKNMGNNLTRLPYVDKKPLDLYQLKKAVDSRGGFDMVCKLKKWAEIGRDLGYSGKIMSSLSTSLKNSYQKWLIPYEEYLRVAKPGVHQQLELENGGPFTPSPDASPMKRADANTPSSLRGDSPARHASDALQASMGGHAGPGSGRATPAPASNTPPPTSSAGFTAVNPGSAASRNGSPLTATKRSSESRLNPAHPLKRQLSSDTLDASIKEEIADGDDDDEGGSRRSKRLKKETIEAIHENCEQCAKGEDAGFLIVCESCDHAYHGKCLDPPLSSKPASEWNCPRCLVGDGQFGFEDGGLYSLRQFQEKASDFKQTYFEKKMPFDPVHNCHRPVTEDDVEREFWRLVSSIDETVEVEYGADIHCTTHGSGFPTIEKNPDDPYSTDPWNLNILPLHPESLFRYIKSDISGMTVPWVYVGMIFSTFCWHNEDHYAYSANYQHFGATKTWYGIPGEDAEKFEAAMKKAVPDLFETQPDLLFQLVTLLPPEKLKEAGVRVYAVDQRAGQFVITFPQAYHAGFNHGFNCNEAVNFAPCDWEPFGLAGIERLQQFRRQPCFSHDELLWTAAEDVTSAVTGSLTIQTAKWLAPAFERIRDREASYRAIFVTRHTDIPHRCSLADKDASRRGIEGVMHSCPLEVVVDDTAVAEEEYQCSYCKAFTYLSRFKCVNTGKVLCLQHAGSHPCCPAREATRLLGESHVLTYQKTSEQIDAMYKKVLEKAQQPEVWEEKYEKALEEDATPALRTLRALLNEGERIPYDLPSLPILREFVDRCNRWVEEATTYLVRKQQNRRKNDRAWQGGARKSVGGGEHYDKERETRNISNIDRLLDEAAQTGFDCPEIQLLQQRADAIRIFQEDAQRALAHVSTQTIETIEKLLDEGHSFNVDVPELERLIKFHDQLKWTQKAEANRGVSLTLDEVSKLLEEGQRLDIPSYNDLLTHFEKLSYAGLEWEARAKEFLGAESIHYSQLENLAAQTADGLLPVSPDTLAAIDQMLHKHRDAHRQIIDLNTRSHDPEYRNRPRYSEVVAVMAKVEELQCKPIGTLDLEREQKRSEDWIRKGKRVFGKTNAPLYILKSHLEYVLDRNNDCFDTVYDKPRTPAEPASREPSPDATSPLWKHPKLREVFCICRRIEAGMMIECEVCHEWYHGKCLKIARGKVKEDDLYTCPICDWRIKIPRDAARPDLESLISLFNEIPSLPFQPEEEQILGEIIQGAMDFRNKIAVYLDPDLTSESDALKQRFYLRKIEGAEILLTRETNFLRQVLHKRFPIAPDPPPLIEESKSTRKPRPTKLQKMMAQYQVDDPEDLPEMVKLRANSTRRKMLNAGSAAEAATASFRSSGPIVPLAPAGASGGGHKDSNVGTSLTHSGQQRTIGSASPPHPFASGSASAPASASASASVSDSHGLEHSPTPTDTADKHQRNSLSLPSSAYSPFAQFSDNVDPAERKKTNFGYFGNGKV